MVTMTSRASRGSVVVTGAAGHIGTNLCLALLADGYEVRAIDLREPARAVRHGARWFRADIRDPAAVGPALDGCEIVYHLAAVISVVGGLRGLVHSVNVDGVRILAGTALERGVSRFVHCSSVHAFDLAAMNGQPADETSPPAVRPELPAYDRSKAAGEVELRRVIDRGLDAVVVNPSGVIGPVDDGPSRMGSVLLALWRRRLPALVAGGFDWVDVRDVVGALRSAGSRGRTGESYLIPGHRVGVGEIARLAASVSTGGFTVRSAPLRLVRAMAPVAELVVRRTGWHLLPTREALHALESFPRVDGSKARRELGHEPRPFAVTLADLHAYFVETGRLRSVSALE
jgi:dihydroflavonol-4-reductase